MIKDRKRVKEKNRKLEKNQTRLNRILDLLGVASLHKTLYLPLREHLVNYPDPPLSIEYDGTMVPDCVKETIGWWATAKYKGMTSSDFIEVLRPLMRVIYSARDEEVLATRNEKGSYKPGRKFVDCYAKAGKEYVDYFQREFRNLFIFLTWRGTSLDVRYVKPRLEWDIISNQRMRTRINIKAIPAQSSRFAGHLNHRVGCQMKTVTGIEGDSVQWLSQSPVALGLPGRDDERLPVYISQHALERMRERLDNFEARLLIAPCTYISMRKPVVHPLRNLTECDDSLVEFRLMNSDVKAGYFVVSRTEREIFIRTFLFLTMHKTPEGNLLHRRLRMARPDFDFHKLEKYSTFQTTDIATHPKLVPIWNECGFGKFLEWVRTGHQPDVIQSMGDEFVKYFRLERDS